MASMDDVLGSLDDQAKQKQAQTDKIASSAEAAQNTAQIVGAVDKSTQATTDGLKNVKGEVKVTNPTDMNGVVDSINKLNLTTFMQNEGLPKLAQNLSELSGKTQDLQDKLENEGLKKMSDQLGLVVKKLDEVSKTLSKTEVTVDTKLQKTIDNLSKSIGAIDFNPNVTVSAPPAKVVTTPVDFKPVLSALGSVEQAIKDSEAPETEIDLSAVTSGLADVHNAITALRFPVPNYVLPFRGIDGKATQVQLDANGNLPTAGGGGGGGAVTIADGAAVTLGTTSDVSYVSGSGTLIAISKGIFSKLPAQGQSTMSASQPVTIASDQSNLPGNTKQLNGTTIDTNSGVKSGGTQRVVLATDQPNLTTPFNVNTIAQATGGYTPAKLISAATTNATSVKGSAGTLGFMSAGNISGSPRYIKLYNKASAPTVGTDVPVQVYVVPGNTAGSGFMVPLPGEGLNFSTGIAFAITAGITDADTTAIGASEVALSYGTA